MATVSNPTDPRDTKRLYKNLISIFIYVFKPILVLKYYAKVCLPSNIYSNNVYGIFFFFFSRDVLNIIMKHTNKYGARHYQHLKML